MCKRNSKFFLTLMLFISASLFLASANSVCYCSDIADRNPASLSSFVNTNEYNHQFTDIAPEEWYINDVINAYEKGLIVGESETSFAPDNYLTLAEAIKMAACIHSIYYTGATDFEDASPWYEPYVEYALDEEIISEEFEDYNQVISRLQFASIFAKALPDKVLPKINIVDDNAIPDMNISHTGASEVYKLYQSGILIGSDSAGNFYPQSSIRRCEAAAILTRMTNESSRKEISLFYKRTGPTTFYVSVKGNNSNPGTLVKPWKTIQKAADSARAGDTVFIRGGNYNERIRLKASGTRNNYITFSNYQSEAALINGANIDWDANWGCLFDLNSQSYIKISGLRVINSSWAGIGSQSDENGCRYVIVNGCSTYNTQSSGITFFTGGKITVYDNSIEKACVATNGSQEGLSLAEIDSFVIRNNYLFNFTNDVEGKGGEGIDVKNGCSDGKIYGNTIHDIAKIGIYVDAYSKTQYNIEVYGNNIYNCAQGITVATEHGGMLENVNVHDNTIKNCEWGLAIGGWNPGYSHSMDGIIFNKNVLSGIRSNGLYLNNPEAENVIVTNNIFGGTDSCTPIYVNGGNLDETTIDGNALNRIVNGHPTGTNYILL